METILNKYKLHYTLDETHIFNDKCIKIKGNLDRPFYRYYDILNIIEDASDIEIPSHEYDRIFDNELYISDFNFCYIVIMSKSKCALDLKNNIYDLLHLMRDNLHEDYTHIIYDQNEIISKLSHTNTNNVDTDKLN
ncbi:unknown similar to AMEV180 [Choristoneura rosaceana entomopoxvirus 'L']|uniref:N1R/p28-like protein n=1 Tax=Choristoneura rosaceana entomopoxvirus 'L' TaxID=1293539 RepID=A0ABM9QKN1_9POXV|nr:unknown similar to AMEV180 [Choristoneura rosaceana entomopoxvirus 'L']CCU56089.1 unknown similar to AMEV180 [Choristoneura rosaceana entomopoxvirus 'L']